jgi:hypothetical protein
MSTALYILAGWYTFAALVTITQVGKPRGPLTPGTAAVVVLLTAVTVVVMVLAASQGVTP